VAATAEVAGVRVDSFMAVVDGKFLHDGEVLNLKK
jgi:hypothetical protein